MSMSLPTVIGLFLSIFVVGAMWWGCTFEIQHIIVGDLVTAAGGKFKFLTILNMVIERVIHRLT
jgi:hypothetical protein